MKKINKPDPYMTDDDNPELDESFFKKAVPFNDMPEEFKRAVGMRGKQKAPKKVPISIRLSAEVIDKFKSTGDGWQSRIDDALIDWLKHHPV